MLTKGLLDPMPKLHIGPIASGPVVVTSKEFISWVKTQNRQFLALEMEGGGALAAVYSVAEPSHTMMLRGISDFGDDRKRKFDNLGGGGIRQYAMRNVIGLLWNLMAIETFPYSKESEPRMSQSIVDEASRSTTKIEGGPVAVVKIEIERSAFDEAARALFKRELAGLLGIKPDEIIILRIVDGSVIAELQFVNEDALVRFINMVAAGDAEIQQFRDRCRISDIQFKNVAATADSGVKFDTFLSHNSKDKPIIRELFRELKKRGVRPWLDEEHLIPGRPWQVALEEVIGSCRTAIVAFGPSGLGSWEEPEMRACLSEFVNRKLPVIPLLLPGAPDIPTLPLFMRGFTWVDLRAGLNDDGLQRLIWGITGKKPN